MKLKYIIYLIVILQLILSGACKKDVPTTPEQPEKLGIGSKVGETATNYTAKDQNGNDVSLYDYSGKVIFFEFSADWCGPCRAEAPHLETLFNEYKARGLQVITLLISGSTSAWAQQYNQTFPVLDDNSETIWDIYGEGSVPLNIIADRNLVIRYKQAGYDENGIKQIIEKYL
jgi:peroxiredoxin